MLLGKEVVPIHGLYACDSCCSMIPANTVSVLLCYRTVTGSIFFKWHCMECQEVTV